MFQLYVRVADRRQKDIRRLRPIIKTDNQQIQGNRQGEQYNKLSSFQWGSLPGIKIHDEKPHLALFPSHLFYIQFVNAMTSNEKKKIKSSVYKNTKYNVIITGTHVDFKSFVICDLLNL